MNDGITWVILTDGNFIKIMFNKARGSELKTLRDDDFEHTSEIAYKMVTRKRALTMKNPGHDTRQEEQSFFLQLLVDFLAKQLENNAFQNLILVAPGNIVDIVNERLPKTAKDKIVATVREDYLLLSQDKIQERLAGKY